MIEIDQDLSGQAPKEAYMVEVKKWAIYMLTTLRSLPSTAEKLTLLRQVDKVKDAYYISVEELPAYSGALAVLSNKAVSLLTGKSVESGYSKKRILDLLRSNILRAMMDKDPEQFIKLKDFLEIKSMVGERSETLSRLSRSGR